MAQAKKRNTLVTHQFIYTARRGKTEPLAQLLLVEEAIFFFHSPASIPYGRNAFLDLQERSGSYWAIIKMR